MYNVAYSKKEDNMKRNLWVILGAVIVLISAFPQSYATYGLKLGNDIPMPDFNYHTIVETLVQVLLVIVVLGTLFTKWKWRGYLWLGLTVVAALAFLISIYNFYEHGIYMLKAAKIAYPNVESSLTPFKFGMGTYSMILGYLLIVFGSVRDIIKKNRANELTE
jgi:hypothetical protein